MAIVIVSIFSLGNIHKLVLHADHQLLAKGLLVTVGCCLNEKAENGLFENEGQARPSNLTDEQCKDSPIMCKRPRAGSKRQVLRAAPFL